MSVHKLQESENVYSTKLSQVGDEVAALKRQRQDLEAQVLQQQKQ